MTPCVVPGQPTSCRGDPGTGPRANFVPGQPAQPDPTHAHGRPAARTTRRCSSMEGAPPQAGEVLLQLPNTVPRHLAGGRGGHHIVSSCRFDKAERWMASLARRAGLGGDKGEPSVEKRRGSAGGCASGGERRGSTGGCAL
jgi:hypothetical protein